MTITITPIQAGFAAKIEGVEARTASDSDVAAIKAAMGDYPVVVLPGQQLGGEEHVAFARRFGPLDTNELAQRFHKPDISQDMIEPSNNDRSAPDYERMRLMELSNTFWHTDGSYKAVPIQLSMLYSIEAAKRGGETQFADMRSGYDSLPDDLKAMVEDMVAEHNAMQRRLLLGYQHSAEELAALKPVGAYPVVRTLPESGRRSLYLSGHATHIIGLPFAEGRVLLNELTELATAPEHVYTHIWSRQDLVIFDNRCTMHRIKRYDVATEKRHLRRVSTRDDAFPSVMAAMRERSAA